MKKLKAFMIAICLPALGLSFDKLDDKYLTLFGDPQAFIQITQYFSMTCPHCLSLFKKDFKVIKEKYLDPKKAAWSFHPVPLDSLTIQLMDCLSKLNPSQKVIFLEALFDTIQVQDSPDIVLFLMQEAMKTFNHPIPELDQDDYIKQTPAFWDAFNFIKQEDRLAAVPAVEVNNVLYRREIPGQTFIEKQMQERVSHD
jgi:hypothetical protein